MASGQVVAGTGNGLIHLSDCLGSPARADRWLAEFMGTVPLVERIVLDVASVSFMCPYGAVLLLSVCRHLAPQSTVEFAHESAIVSRIADFFGLHPEPSVEQVGELLARRANALEKEELCAVRHHDRARATPLLPGWRSE